MNSVLQNLRAAKQNCSQLLVLATLAARNPTPQNVDQAVSAINAGTYNGPLVPRPTYSLDGESYNWSDYAEMLTRQMAAINDLISKESVPWIVRGRARP